MEESSIQKSLLAGPNDDDDDDDDDRGIPAADSNLSFDGSVLTSDLLGDDKLSSDEYEQVDYLEIMDQLSPEEYRARTRQIVQHLQEERENAFFEVEEAREAMSDVMEAVKILSRQMRTRHLHALEPNGEGTQDINSTTKQETDSSSRNPGRVEDINSQGQMCRSVADYMNEDSKRLSELISSNSMLSSVGIDIMSLSHSCRMVEENSLYISQEASTSIRDIQALNESISTIQDRCSKVERCAKRLYKQNKRLKRIVKNNEVEKMLLVKEIKHLRQEKETRKGWDEQILDSFGVHEKIMMGDSPRSVIKPVLSDLREIKNAKQKNLVIHGSEIEIEKETDCVLVKSSSVGIGGDDNTPFAGEPRTQAEGERASSTSQDLLVNFPVLQLSPSNGSDRKAKGSTLELSPHANSGRSDCKERHQGTRIRYLPFGKR
jgi:hypothetical protein